MQELTPQDSRIIFKLHQKFGKALKDYGLIADGDKVQIIGFGTFEAKEQAAREGRNPATGEKIEIAACKRPAFSASQALKDKVNA